jgi:serine/threonine protein kinase
MIMKEHPHGNIVQFHNSYLVGDELWVVMEYVNGGALTAMIQKTRYDNVDLRPTDTNENSLCTT